MVIVSLGEPYLVSIMNLASTVIEQFVFKSIRIKMH